MENHDHNPEEVVYLKMNLHCCCPKELHQELLKMKGVYSPIVDRKRNMVMIVTKIDPRTIVEMIKEKGKFAEIFNPIGHDVDQSTRNSKTSKEGNNSGSNEHHTVRFRGKNPKMPRDCIHEETSQVDGSHGYNDIDHKITARHERKHRHGKKIKEEHVCEPFEIPRKVDYVGKKKDDHVCESYEKPEINKLICRDFYCKSHAQRGLIYSKVPSIDSEDHPCHTNGFLDELGMEGNSLFEQSVPIEYFPQRISPFPYPTSIMPGNHDYTYSRMTMPLPRYDDHGHAYSRRAMPLAGGYDEHISYSAGRRYDEHTFSERTMPFHGCGNQ